MFRWLQKRKWLDCPCCGFPTLSAYGQYEICVVCWWEDDGQSDTDADEVWGGPNYQYSLTAARKNFADHGDKYDRGKGIEVVENPLPERTELIQYALNVHSGEIQFDVKQFRRLVKRLRRADKKRWAIEDALDEA